ncbi:MAG TPA: ATP-dependent RNA helicase HrpA [Frankiaceae bacterium]
MSPVLTELQSRLPALTLRDERRIGRRLDGVRRMKDADRQAEALAQVADDLAAAEQRVAARAAAVPAQLNYPEQLPVSAERERILATLRDHQVVVLAGETGSGKTTQLPKMLLEIGRGVRGMIGHTQPRRLAARSVAERIAEEIGTPLGDAVGFQVRFNDRSSERTLVKLMTDGILLAEIQSDRMLSKYDTIVIDEAHERSLNIDFLLGYLKQLLPRRPDLKLVITSATIETARFSKHFDDAPVIEVTGRTYPVEVRYRPLQEDETADVDEAEDDGPTGGQPPRKVARDPIQAICDAVVELRGDNLGDVLVFLSGEREIRDAADALRALELPTVEILPLFARLSAAEQHKIFASHTGQRIVLATNVAETSLTVPGIRNVVDTGTARISRYSHRTKVQRLPIEPVSQASANQRAGRCGRTSDGICIRLYSETDFVSRPEFTDPEILRTNLASVILQMTSLGLGEIAKFPFVDPPDRKAITDGLRLLMELGALESRPQDPEAKLTALGRQLSRLPVDPRMGRMILEGDRNGCLDEVLVITAALSIQDVRERPSDKQEAADAAHRPFRVPGSDFLSLLQLWRHLQEQQDLLSSNAFRRQCRAEFLNYLRVREWQELYGQLKQISREMELTRNTTPAPAAAVHQALLSGLLSHIGLRDPEKRDYLGARGSRFSIFPGSGLAKKQPDFVMAAELVETSRLFARTVAKIEPEWAEKLAPHLVTRSYSAPHWSKKRGSVVASEKVTLFGVPLVAGRTVEYGRIDPELSRDLFLRNALVEGDWNSHHAFLVANRDLIARGEELQARARRRDLVIDDESLFDFYDKRVPASVVSGGHFDAWWKQERRNRPDLLTLTEQDLLAEAADDITASDYPDHWMSDDLALPLSYQFEPGTDADGVTVHIPVAVLNRVRPDGFDWQIPGLRDELVTAAIRVLPKELRRSFVPAPDVARHLLSVLRPEDGPFATVLARELTRRSRVEVTPADVALEKLPDHLRMTFRVVDGRGRTLAEGKDLPALAASQAGRTQRAVTAAAGALERAGLTSFDVDDVPTQVSRDRGGHAVHAYPALVDEGDTVALRALADPVTQERAHRAGVRKLLLLNLPSPAKLLRDRLTVPVKLALTGAPHADLSALLADVQAAAVDALVAECGGPPRDKADYERVLLHARQHVHDRDVQLLARVTATLQAAQEVRARLATLRQPAYQAAVADVTAQLTALVHPGFVTETGAARLAQLPRYLTAMERRLERLTRDVPLDTELMRRVHGVEGAYRAALAAVPVGRPVPPVLGEVRWLLEELRVSLFAQQLGTPVKVSEERLYRMLDGAR